jgi:hypothetical protein
MNINGHLIHYKTNVNNKIDNDQTYNTEFNTYNKKTHNVNNVTNTKLIQNELNYLLFNDNVNKQYNAKFNINDLTLIKQDHEYDTKFDIQNNTLYKNNNMANGHNVYINSSFILPACSQYNFLDMPQSKNNINMNNNMPVFRDIQQTLSQETDTIIKHHPYSFNDNISLVTNNTDSNIKLSEVHDIETDTKLNSKYQQEHKVVNTNTDNTWLNSSENNNSGKSQKQQRTSGTDDQYVYEIQKPHDFESFSSGIGMGNKLLRGDYIDQEDISFLHI